MNNIYHEALAEEADVVCSFPAKPSLDFCYRSLYIIKYYNYLETFFGIFLSRYVDKC